MNCILYNCHVYPQHRVSFRPTSVVIRGNRIADLGTDPSLLRLKYPKYELIDLKGRAVLPGLVDAHTHFYYWVRTFGDVHLDGIINFDRVLKIIRKHAGKLGPGEWVTGDGWSADRWQPYHLPTASELDAVTVGHPAAIYSKDHHMLWVNSLALRMAGIDKNFRTPSGSKVDRNPEDGTPSGILRETPVFPYITQMILTPGNKKLDTMWSRAAKIAYRRGITGFHSVDNSQGWEYFNYRHRQGRLGFRVHYYFPVSRLEELIREKVVSGAGDDTLRIGGVKIFADGSLGSQTALLKKRYKNRGSYGGLEVHGISDLTAFIRRTSRNGLACAIHAIGDQAVSNAITAFEKGNVSSSLRHRIEHLQLIDRRDISRLRSTGVIASMQPSHCPSDRDLVAAYWGARGRNAFIFKTLLRMKIPLCFGSDCPIEALHPLQGIHAAVNRNGYGERGSRFYPGQRLTVAQAVQGFTTGAAYAAGRESFSGKLIAGYQADLVILDDDIYEMPPSQIYKASVTATIYDGRFVYKSASF